jgi:hypothetical protein
MRVRQEDFRHLKGLGHETAFKYWTKITTYRSKKEPLVVVQAEVPNSSQ